MMNLAFTPDISSFWLVSEIERKLALQAKRELREAKRQREWELMYEEAERKEREEAERAAALTAKNNRALRIREYLVFRANRVVTRAAMERDARIREEHVILRNQRIILRAPAWVDVDQIYSPQLGRHKLSPDRTISVSAFYTLFRDGDYWALLGAGWTIV